MAQARHSDYVVRFVNEQGITKEKSFKTEAARAKWLDKNEPEVLAISDPQ